MRWNEVITEDQEDYTGPKILGHHIPNWSNPNEVNDAAYFEVEPFYSPAQVIARDGKIEVWFHTEDQHFLDSPEQAEALLKQRGYDKFDTYGGFSPVNPVDESLDSEKASDLLIRESIPGINDIPDITGLDYGDTMPVAEFQKRTKYADMPARVWVYKSGKRWMVVQGDNDFSFTTTQKLEAWLEKNKYIHYVGNTEVYV